MTLVRYRSAGTAFEEDVVRLFTVGGFCTDGYVVRTHCEEGADRRISLDAYRSATWP